MPCMVHAAFACTVLLLHLNLSSAKSSLPIFSKKRHQLQQKKETPAANAIANSTADDSTAPVVVPEAVDVGSNGFPVLPDVSQMLGEASSTLKSVNSEANFLEKRLVAAQSESTQMMAKQKAAFERKLKAQEKVNRAVIIENADISDNIAELKKDNDELRIHAQELQNTNRLMRNELHILESRLGVAKDFVTQSLSSTDDSKAAVLNVLQLKVQGHHAKSEEGAEDSDDSDEESDSPDDSEADESFLALSSSVRRVRGSSTDVEVDAMEEVSTSSQQHLDASPPDLLDELSKEVASLAKQEKASEKKLKELFIRDFRAGARRHQALLQQQRALNVTRHSLLATQSELQTADAHLEGTRSQLEQRLHSMGQFMQRLAHLALASEKEVKHILHTLPEAPALPQAKQGQTQTQVQ